MASLLAYEAWPGKHGLLRPGLGCLSAALHSTHCATHIHVHVRVRRLPRCEHRDLRPHAESMDRNSRLMRIVYLLASRFCVASITMAWLVAVGSRPAAGILKG
jgi:uncharacterized membrane protein